MKNKTFQIIIFGFILLLIGIIVYLILTRPDPEKPAIIKHETEIKQDTRKIDSISALQRELRDRLTSDSLKSIVSQRAFKSKIQTLEKNLIEQRAQAQALIDSVPALNAFVDTQDSIIVVQAERIDSLQTEKSIQWMRFNKLLLASDEKFDLAVEVNSHYKAINEIRQKENRRLKKANKLLLVAIPTVFMGGVILAK